MRLLSIFCVLLVMALNMVPCADAHESVAPSLTAAVAATATEHGHSDQADDACTPFCHCSCCAASVVLKVESSLAAPFPVHQILSLPHLTSRSIDVSLSVWQPPKLA